MGETTRVCGVKVGRAMRRVLPGVGAACGGLLVVAAVLLFVGSVVVAAATAGGEVGRRVGVTPATGWDGAAIRICCK